MFKRQHVSVVPSVIAAVFQLAVAGFAFFVCFVALREQFTTPYRDDWRILHDFYTQPLGEWLLSSQAGYRVPFTLWLLFIDQIHFSGTMRVPVIASMVCAALSVVFFRAGLHADGCESTPLSRTILGFGCFCLFWGWGSFVFYWGVDRGSRSSAL